MSVVIITRHPALVQYLREDLGIEGSVLAHATAEDVDGKIVVGILPLHLASLASRVGSIDLRLPAELRGVELTVEQVREYASPLAWYVVRTMESYDNVCREAGWFLTP